MSIHVNDNTKANFQTFVDFANDAYSPTGKGEDTAARLYGAPTGDYKGTFASLRRTLEMKKANNAVRDLFRKTIADMFGGEKFIPDIVRDNMKFEDFGKGRPLTARRIKLVKIAIDTLGGGKFADAASIQAATSKGYFASDLPKLARVANIYQQATGCTNEEAEAVALDPGSKARRLFDYGGRFTLNANNFKKGLALMEKFDGWYSDLMDSRNARKDTPTKLNVNLTVCTAKARLGVEKFVFEEISVNSTLSLSAKNPEDVFGMAKNPAMQFVGRGYITSLSASLAQMPPEKRELIYAVFSALDKLPMSAAEIARNKERKTGHKIEFGTIVAARVMRNFDAVAALRKSGKLNRAHLVPILYGDLDVPANADNNAISTAIRDRLFTQTPEAMGQISLLAENSGLPFDEVESAFKLGKRLENAPGISSFTGNLNDIDGTARGGRDSMIVDLNRASTPMFTKDEKAAIEYDDAKFVFHFPDGETLESVNGSGTNRQVAEANNAIADKVAGLCGNVHPKQLSNVYYALSQSGIGSNVKGAFSTFGISSDEHMAVTFTLSRNDETGDITIKYSEPKGMPVKFTWTTTIDLEGNVVSTPMRIDGVPDAI